MCRVVVAGDTATLTGRCAPDVQVVTYAFRPGTHRDATGLGTWPQTLYDAGVTALVPPCGQADAWQGPPPLTLTVGADLSGFRSGVRTDAGCAGHGTLAFTGLAVAGLLLAAVLLVVAGAVLSKRRSRPLDSTVHRV